VGTATVGAEVAEVELEEDVGEEELDAAGVSVVVVVAWVLATATLLVCVAARKPKAATVPTPPAATVVVMRRRRRMARSRRCGVCSGLSGCPSVFVVISTCCPGHVGVDWVEAVVSL
jgi:hypothetical protein